MRSSLHPVLFAAVYRAAARAADLAGLTLPAKANLLLVAPKLIQACLAALLDVYTVKLAEKAYGPSTRTVFATVRRSTPLTNASHPIGSLISPCISLP